MLEYWLLWGGLGSTDRDGYENWGLLFLPIACLIGIGLAAGAQHLRLRRDRRRTCP